MSFYLLVVIACQTVNGVKTCSSEKSAYSAQETAVQAYSSAASAPGVTKRRLTLVSWESGCLVATKDHPCVTLTDFDVTEPATPEQAHRLTASNVVKMKP